tara:strand:+ start:674 stop:1036 length:363 start_codon:yes stop_codon:yes gene_type:complete
MMENYLDNIIDHHLQVLKEEKYRLRHFKVELIVSIESKYGIEETLADIRSIGGVTIVTALESQYNQPQSKYTSRIRIKFHPRNESITPKYFIRKVLLPTIRSREIPGCTVIRLGSRPEQI